MDTRIRATTRWSRVRQGDGKRLTETVLQPTPGVIELYQGSVDGTARTGRLITGQSVLDPMSFIWAVRRWLPRAAERYLVLAGRDLFEIQVTRTGTKRADDGRSVVALEATVRPFSTKPGDAADDSAQTLTIWLTDDSAHTPIRAEITTPFGSIRATFMGRELGLPKGTTSESPANSL
jgi:hypothetical protein